MPISLDFPEITDAFRRFLALPVRQISHSFEAISAWLEKRVKGADLLEQSSRGFPVIRFEGDAVMMWLDGSQARALLPDTPPKSFSDHLQAAGQKFVSGIGRVKEAVTDEQILPGLFSTFAGAIQSIAESVERFAHPPGEMKDMLFGHPGVVEGDSSARKAGDLFGEAALAFRAFAGSLPQLNRFTNDFGTAFNLPGPSTPAMGPSDPNALPDMLDGFSRKILGILLVLPAIPAFVESLWDSVVIVVKTKVIEAFAGIEASVNRLRQRVIDFFFIALPDILRKAISYITAAQLVLIVNVQFFGRFALGYGQILIKQLTTFFDRVTDFFNKYIGFINSVLDAINEVLKFDIGAALSDATGLPVPTITLDTLISDETNAARIAARVSLTALAEALELDVSLNPFASDSSERQLQALPELTWNVFRKPDELPPETAMIRWPAGYGFPNVYDTFFKPGLPTLRNTIDGLGRDVSQGMGLILGSLSSAFNALGDEFSEQADRASSIDSAARFRRLAETAGRQSRALFGEQVDDLNKQISDRQRDPVADAFESWLATGGFQVIGLAIPAYFQEMQDYWKQKKALGLEPTVRIDGTSPHILAKRAILSRAQVKQVIIKAPGKEVDKDLATAIASQFEAAVQQAYVNGQTRLASIAASEPL